MSLGSCVSNEQSTIEIVDSLYGKQNIQVILSDNRHIRVDIGLTLNDTLEYTDGNNVHVVSTEATKNLALEYFSTEDPLNNSIDKIGESLRRRLENAFEPKRVVLKIDSKAWKPVTVKSSGYRFTKSENQMGFIHLKLLKLNGSSFRGFRRDNNYTRLEYTDDRPFHISIKMEWLYVPNLSTSDLVGHIEQIFETYSSTSLQNFIHHLHSTLVSEFKFSSVSYEAIHHHYVKLSQTAISPLNDEFGQINVSYW